MEATTVNTVRKKIGKYEITGVLGRGGMGVVYRGEDRRIGRQVAIKTLTEGFTGQPEMLERFYREAQAGILQHPNIVIVYDLGDEEGMPFIVMEFVDGEPLDKIISSGRQLHMVDKLSIIEQVCAALGYAHQRGVIHRDIKPANVIVQPDGHAKIVDFGIARVQGAKESGLTRTGNVIGTVHYIAPERLKGQAFDGRSDIFAVGVMLYLLLAGQLPFTGEDMTVLQKLVNEPAPPLKTYLTNYPPALDGILDRALAKDPAQRYATAEEFAADLHALGEQLKKGQITELFDDAERLATEQHFGRAREVLLQLVRIDPQHTGARQLLGVVQQNLSRLQRAEQVKQLLAEADEAVASSRYPEALNALDQAIKLDPENVELVTRIEEVRQKKQRADEVAGLMTQAESLRERGDWTGAINVLEKALRLDTDNAAIRAAHSELSRQAKLAAQQLQVKELLGKARQEYTAKRYTQAIEILREVGKIDASAPELNTLLENAVTAQEQERRRKLLEQIHAEIENCLASQDFDRANDLVDRAVEKLPTESSLLQLKSKVALQTREFRRRQLIDSTVAKAQETMVSAPGEALLVVQHALQELPGEERLLALEHSLRQRLKAAEKEEIRGQYLRQAQQAIDRGEFEKAVEVLESYQLEFADAAGVGELLDYAKKQLVEQKRRTRVADCVRDARALMEQQQFDRAIALLEPAVKETQDASLDRLLAEARGQRQEVERKAEALLTRIASLRERGQYDEALRALQTAPGVSVAGTKANTLLNEIRAEQARKQAKESALAAAAKASDRDGFQAAIESLQSVQRAWGESPDIAQAISDIESKRSQQANDAVGKAVESARAALMANNAEGAIAELKGVAPWVEFAGATQQTDWKRLGAEASKPAGRKTTGNIPQIGFDTVEAEPAKKSLRIPILTGAVLVLAAVVIAITFLRPKPQVKEVVRTVPGPTTPAAVPVSGTLDVEGDQGNVEIFVDGLLKGFTQSDGSLKVPLDPGAHTVRLAKGGYSDFTQSGVQIAANKAMTLRYTLTKSTSNTPPPVTDAFLSIHSTPGAQVSIDHNGAGTTDARGDLIVQVKPGARTLQIAANGFQPYSQSFNIKAGERNNMSVMLTPIPAVAPKSVTQPVQPVQALFSATTMQIEQGQSTTLQWQTANASEVSISNGIGKVESSGQTTVQPASSTTYVLTASGNDGTLQRSVNITVQPKQAAAPPPPTPSGPKPVDETALLQAVVQKFNGALAAQSVDAMRATWPGMNKSQEKGFQSFFKNNRGGKMSDSCSPSSLTVSGETATWVCNESTTILAGGRPTTYQHSITFAFKKAGGNWVIADRH
ncbi:MAG TPA: protein kinase [Terracidiphilus sp.]|nr:protein kinase [Terracidiphilus sp.]